MMAGEARSTNGETTQQPLQDPKALSAFAERPSSSLGGHYPRE